MHFAVPEQVEEQDVRQDTLRQWSVMSGVSYEAVDGAWETTSIEDADIDMVDYARDSMSICIDQSEQRYEGNAYEAGSNDEQSVDEKLREMLEEEAANQPWKLHLPIYGSIALRRAFRRNLDPEEVMREQGVRARHEIELKYGALRDVEVTFKPIEWSAQVQPHSQIVAETEGEPLSPAAMPAPRYVSATGDEKALPVSSDDPVPSIEDPNANLPRPRIMTRSWGIGYRLVAT